MNRRSLLIGLGAAFLVLLIWYFLLWNPRGNAIDAAKSRREAAEGQVAELTARLNQLRDAQRNEASTRAQIARLQEAIPDEANLAQFILDSNDAATRSGIDFLSISPTPPAAGSTVDAATGAPVQGVVPSQITLSISITGGYFQVLDFVNRLTDLPRIVVIDGLTVSGGQGGDLSVSITGRMFTTQGPAGETPTTTTTVPGATTTTAPGATPTTVAGAAPTTVAGTPATVAP